MITRQESPAQLHVLVVTYKCIKFSRVTRKITVNKIRELTLFEFSERVIRKRVPYEILACRETRYHSAISYSILMRNAVNLSF